MRIFMTGGTGMIGRRLLSRLRDRGDEVIIVSRSANEIRRRAEFRDVRVIPGDVTTPGLWQDEVDGTDAVVNLAGENIFASRWTSDVRARIRDSRVLGTENLIVAIRNARRKPSVFVHGSAVGFYGSHGDEELTELAESGVDFLAVICRELEDAARPVETLEVRLATIRTGVVLGKGEGALGVMAPLFRWGGAAPVGSGDHPLRPARGLQWLSWIHLDDIVGLFLLALDHPDAKGPINGTAPAPSRNIDFSRALARALHRPFLPIGPPDLLLDLVLGGVAQSVTKGQRVIPAQALSLGYVFEHSDVAEAIRSALAGPRLVTPPGRPKLGTSLPTIAP